MRVSTRRIEILRLADEAMRQVSATADSKYAIGMDVRDFELRRQFGRQTDSKTCTRVNLQSGERKLALKKARWVQTASPDGSHILYYDDGVFYTFDLPNRQVLQHHQGYSRGVLQH